MSVNFDAIISGDLEALEKFVTTNSLSFSFPDLNYNDRRTQLWKTLFCNLQNSTSVPITLLCLSAIRTLSREKEHLNEQITNDRFELLSRLAGLQSNEYNSSEVNKNPNFEIIIEALKSLCNIVYNSTVAQKFCSENCAVDGIINRLRISSGDPDIPYDVRFYDMKLLFLITALNTETRSHLKNELHGLTYLTETIDSVLRDAQENIHDSMEGQVSLTEQQAGILCEILKVLFNITIKSSELSVDEEDEVHYSRLVTVLHDLLLTPTRGTKKELHNQIINILTCVPPSSYQQLCPKLLKGQDVPKTFEYDGYNMEAVNQLLQNLKSRLIEQPTAMTQQEILSPILTTFNRSVRNVREIRKYLRVHILPPLKEVHKRPEEGDSLRNYLCRLLTTPCTSVRDLTADLLFVLCKENVNRMIKYTGYGNAAGLFATRGLMDVQQRDNGFSSDSEDSDTEIYKEFRDSINPVVGCYEKPKPDPLANMSDEQKEYEAMQLVELMDKLQRTGVIQPCRIGEDGKPVAVEHILQLQEEIPAQQVTRNNQD